MPDRWIRPACLAALAIAWSIDLVTPQALVVAILFNVPIALSSLALDPRFTRALVGLAFVASAVAGYVNGAQDAYRWDAIAVADRSITALSFALVGALSIATQRAALRAGELGARAARAAREAGVRRAIERVRDSVNAELIRRAIVREALEPLAADIALFVAFEPNLDAPTTYRATRERPDDVEVSDRRPAPEILSLVHRLAERGERIATVEPRDALGRLILATLDAPYAIVARASDLATTFGALVLVRRDDPFEPDFEEGLCAFVDHAALALARAELFIRLAERNADLADANERLRERGDVIRDIVYALSHDLRTPLSAARRTMVQAREGAFGPLPEPYRDVLERSIASNDELERLAETLLLVSRYESGEASTHRAPVALATLARAVVDDLTPLWEAKALCVSVGPADVCETDVVVDGDERDLRRAIVNLVANAIAWTPRGRSIAIGLRANDAHVELAVADEGYGIAASETSMLFERVRATPGRRGAGSGLGLYLVRRIAEGHGGSVAYEPRSGGGSTFTVTLPRAPVAPGATVFGAEAR